MVFKHCCCCLNLRVGAIVLATITILTGLIRLGGCLFGLYYWSYWDVILGALANVAAGGCLLYGAIKYQRYPTIIYLVFAMIGIVLNSISAIIIFTKSDGAGFIREVVHGCLRVKPEWCSDDALGWMFILSAFLGIYFWLCVFSFLKEFSPWWNHLHMPPQLRRKSTLHEYEL